MKFQCEWRSSRPLKFSNPGRWSREGQVPGRHNFHQELVPALSIVGLRVKQQKCKALLQGSTGHRPHFGVPIAAQRLFKGYYAGSTRSVRVFGGVLATDLPATWGHLQTLLCGPGGGRCCPSIFHRPPRALQLNPRLSSLQCVQGGPHIH